MRSRDIFVVFLIFMIIASGLPLLPHISEIGNAIELPVLPATMTSSYNESFPIVIDGDSDFASQANTNSWPGDGSLGAPYVLSNYNITLASTSGRLIKISNTDSHFRVEDSLLVGGSIGIEFINVSFGRVVNTSIRNCADQGVHVTETDRVLFENNSIYDIGWGGYGAYFVEVFHSQIINNTFRNSGSRGILVDYGSNCTFSDNHIHTNHSTGLYLRDSNGHRIQRNVIHDNYGNGITLGNSWYCNITENHVYNNGYQGISLQGSSHTLVEENLVHNHGHIGIRGGGHSIDVRNNIVYSCGDNGMELSFENCTAEYNLVYNSRLAGVIVKGDRACIRNNTFYNNSASAINLESNSSLVQYNNFIDNGEFVGRSQIKDDFFENVFSDNYWSEWTIPDADGNLIVDDPYMLRGKANNMDSTPRVIPYTETRIHILSTPVLQSLNGTPHYDEINITWGPAADIFGHDITYSLHYSTGTSDWVLIAANIDATFYLWDITELLDASDYILRITAACSHGLISSSSLIEFFEIRNHTLTEPIFAMIFEVEPGVYATYYDSVPIRWDASIDSYNHDIVYAIYYSIDDGESWTLIADNLVDLSYEWDISDVAPGSNYLLKVVASCTEGLTVEAICDTKITIIRERPIIYTGRNLAIVAVVAGIIVASIIVIRKRRI